MSRSRLARIASTMGVTAGLAALVTSTLVAPATANPPAPAPAAAPTESSNAVALRAWLGKQLTNNLIHNNTTNAFDLNASADLAFALDDFGDKTGAKQVADAVLAKAPADWFTSTKDGVTTTYSAPLAKGIVLAQLTGTPPTGLGGVDQVAKLESLVAKDAPISGRVQDDKNSAGDSAGVAAQIYAARALTTAGHARAGDAMSYLLKQQCSGGYFRADLTKDKTATLQACTAGAPDSAASLETTALAIINLVGLKNDAAAQTAVANAVIWLKAQQAGDGGYGAPANPVATGLAGWALTVAGASAEATKAATWLRGQQVVELAPCASALTRDNGAISPSPAALNEAQVAGAIPVSKQPEWRRAGSLALVPIKQLPKADKATAFELPTFIRANRTTRLKVSGLASGEKACLSFGPNAVPVTGAGKDQLVPVKVPAGTKPYTFKLTTLGGDAEAGTKALSARRVPFSMRAKSIRRGMEQKLSIRGLVEGEKIVVRYRGRKVAETHADVHGKAVVTFGVTGRRGPAKLVVRGEFPDRRNEKQIWVR